LSIEFDWFLYVTADERKFCGREGTIKEFVETWHQFAKTRGEVSKVEMKGCEDGGHVWMLVSERRFSGRVECVLGEAFVVEQPITKVIGASIGARCSRFAEVCVRAGEISDEFACGTHGSGEKVAEGAGGEYGSIVCNARFEVRNGAERLGNEVWVGSEDFDELLDE